MSIGSNPKEKFSLKSIIVFHGFPCEVHETGFLFSTEKSAKPKVIEGNSLQISSANDGIVTIDYKITESQTVVSIGSPLQVIIVNRYAAFDLWVPNNIAIAESPYLIGSAEITKSGMLALRGDLNLTRGRVEVFADDTVRAVSFNGRAVSVRKTSHRSQIYQN
ncbi:hypothetical protein EV426DRAFT_707004 [Tirmania nivea]|nr:hypothetical protein EV426DRAFT_707004 [Tirmania nivea]